MAVSLFIVKWVCLLRHQTSFQVCKSGLYVIKLLLSMLSLFGKELSQLSKI
jgi:hypothetical protein